MSFAAPWCPTCSRARPPPPSVAPVAPILPAFPFESDSHPSPLGPYTSFLDLSFSDDDHEPREFSLLDLAAIERRLFFSRAEERAEYGLRESALCEKVAGQFEDRIEGAPGLESRMSDFWDSIK
ncbi:hypothetical protein JCM1840_005938 [Sporobolomyces johnsonii]